LLIEVYLTHGSEAGKFKSKVLASEEGVLIASEHGIRHHMVRQSLCTSSGLSSSYKVGNAIMGAPSSLPHLSLITSQRHHSQKPLTCKFWD
jgi:hypothetical protein